MTRITLILFLFINLLQSQNLDIGKMSNSDLDKLRDSLKEERKHFKLNYCYHDMY